MDYATEKQYESNDSFYSSNNKGKKYVSEAECEQGCSYCNGCKGTL